MLVLACGAEPSAPNSEPSFSVAATSALIGTDLGTLGGSNDVARAISQSGLIGGSAQTPDGTVHSVIFQGGAAPTVLPQHKWSGSGVFGLSDLADGSTVAVAPQIVWSRTAGGAWSTASELPSLGGGLTAFSVNAAGLLAGQLTPSGGSGAVVGEWSLLGTGTTATFWTPPATPSDAYTVLPIEGLPGCMAHSVRWLNDAGTASGWSVCPSGRKNVSVPFFVAGGSTTATALPMGGYSSIEPAGVSQAGHIAGMASAGRRSTAVLLWTPNPDGTYGDPQLVLEIASNAGFVMGVNSCGTVLGRRMANDDIQGFLVTPDGQVTDLYPIPGGIQPVPNEINDNGTAVGFTWFRTGKGKAETVSRRATVWQGVGC